MDGMSYTKPSFTLPVNNKKISDLEWDLRVGKITQEEYDQRVAEVAPTMA